MGFLDLSSVSSKKNTDLNDPRYHLSDKCKQVATKAKRPSFSLYDNKEKNSSIQEITAAYMLSDKKIPIGEMLNKMVDIIIDLEDGVLNSYTDHVYAWKYSLALIEMFEDKIKRQEDLTIFDNRLKSSIVNSQTFAEQFPGKYTNRTNFFDQKLKEELVSDILTTFKDVALPKIHGAAVLNSQQIAEKHNNPILDKIVDWAIKNYNCEVDTFFDVKKDETTQLYYSTNTIILHLQNGYDMSIIGSVGTEHDDNFAISVFDASNLSLSSHNEKMTQDELKAALTNASKKSIVDPLTKLLKMEKKKNSILKKQYEILANIRPMISADLLNLKAASSIVSNDYVWGCKKFRETHEDLPKDFKLEDVKLPELSKADEELDGKSKKAMKMDVSEMASGIKAQLSNSGTLELDASSMIKETEKETNATAMFTDIQKNQPKKTQYTIGEKDENAYEKNILLPFEVRIDNSVDEKKNKQNNMQFQKQEKSTLLPGLVPSIKEEKIDLKESITQQAKPVPQKKNIEWKETETIPVNSTQSKTQQQAKIETPELNMDALFG